jgi:uncharacterized protein with von Willebrand factor type A (vWA) domain
VSRGALAANLLLFAHVLRRAGLDVHTGRVIDAVTALDWVGIEHRADVRATLETLFVHRQDDRSRFDEAFDLFWRAHTNPTHGLPLFSLGERPRVVTTKAPAASLTFDDEHAGGDAPRAPRLAVGAYSAAHVSRTKDFKDFSAAELTAAEAALAELGWELGVRRTRRWSAGTAGGIDLRRIVRRNMKHGGELIDVPRRERHEKARPIVILADVSGSMEPYSRMLMHFVSGLTQGTQRVESFVFATRLTRVTRLVAGRGAPFVLKRIAHSVQDWGGGTRIGEVLRAFNVHWARRVMRNGPVVLLVSDGWDRGDPELLERELARVRRSCRRLVWLNPLLGSANYEPLTRGMLAALRHVDDFRPVHNLLSLEQLAEHLRDSRKGRVGVTRQRHSSRPDLQVGR